MPITFVDRNGPPAAMHFPAIICDVCGEPIDTSRAHGVDDGEEMHGWVLWNPTYPNEDERPVITCFLFVHGGSCNRKADAAHDHHHYSRGLDRFLENLMYNFQHPFEEDPNVKYVAPKPSRWRLGFYKRAS